MPRSKSLRLASTANYDRSPSSFKGKLGRLANFFSAVPTSVHTHHHQSWICRQAWEQRQHRF